MEGVETQKKTKQFFFWFFVFCFDKVDDEVIFINFFILSQETKCKKKKKKKIEKKIKSFEEKEKEKETKTQPL